jgi:hypothetical protein
MTDAECRIFFVEYGSRVFRVEVGTRHHWDPKKNEPVQREGFTVYITIARGPSHPTCPHFLNSTSLHPLAGSVYTWLREHIDD